MAADGVPNLALYLIGIAVRFELDVTGHLADYAWSVLHRRRFRCLV